MPLLNQALGVQRPDLSDALYEYNPDGVNFVADQILPMIPVGEQAGQIEVVTRETMLKMNDTRRAKGGAYNRINDYLDKVDYVCKDEGAEIADDYGYRQTVQYNRELGKTRTIKMAIMLAREKRVMDAVFDTDVWSGDALKTDAGTAWATVASADPKADIIAAKKKVRDTTGVTPNALILSELNMDYLLLNKALRAELQYTQTPTLDAIKAVLPGIFGLQKLIIVGARYDTAPEGVSTTATTAIANDNYVSVARVGSANGLASPAVGFTPMFDEDSALPYIVESYWEEQTRSMIYRVRHNITEKITEKAFAHLIQVGGLGT